MKNVDIMSIIRSSFPTTDKEGRRIHIECEQKGNGYNVTLTHFVPKSNSVCGEVSRKIGYTETVYGIEGEARIRAKLEKLAKWI